MSRISFSNDQSLRPQSKDGLRTRTYRSVSVTDTTTRVKEGEHSLGNMSSLVLRLTNRRATVWSLPKNHNSLPRRTSSDYIPSAVFPRHRKHRLASIGAVLSLRKRLSLRDYPKPLIDAKRHWSRVRLWVRIQGNLSRLHRYVISKVINDPSNPFYTFLNQIEEKSCQSETTRNFFFDASYYKANRQMRTAQEVKRILSLPADQRTEDEITCAMIGLRGVSAIAEYPVRLQKTLARYGTFECYDGKRIIVRQGRVPEAFYYVLYGRVMVAVKDDVTGHVEVKCCLQRGHFFGELSIINNESRLSSVITKSYTELLRLSSCVFQKHFMVGGVQNFNDPDHYNFLRSLSFLDGWPLQLLLDNADHKSVAFGYFKRGAVLVKDSNFSDWLIVVKSGSVSVLKKLTKVTSRPLLTKTGSSKPFFGQSYSSSNVTVSLGTAVSAGGSNCTKTSNKNPKDVSPCRPHTSPISQRRLESGLSVNTAENGFTCSLDIDADEFVGEKRTFLDFLNLTCNLQHQTTTEADHRPQFVFVQNLTKGGVFGLVQCLFPDQPSLCVVSNGADCLLINKKMFMSNCPQQLLRRLKTEISPYPSDEKLQEDLVTRVHWEGYKQTVISELFNGAKTRRK